MRGLNNKYVLGLGMLLFIRTENFHITLRLHCQIIVLGFWKYWYSFSLDFGEFWTHTRELDV